MTTPNDIIAMSEPELKKRTVSNNKSELFQAILLMRKKTGDSNFGDIPEIIERKLKEVIEPILSKLMHVTEELSQLRSSNSKLEQELHQCKAQNSDPLIDVTAEIEQSSTQRQHQYIWTRTWNKQNFGGEKQKWRW